jgi:amidohydrolase
MRASKGPPNNRLRRTALRAAAEPERYAAIGDSNRHRSIDMNTRALAFVLIGSFAATTGLSAQLPITTDPVVEAVTQFSEAAVGMRHQIHQNPELGNREFKTADLVATHLRSLGLDVRTGVAHTGVVGILKGARRGGTVALRADMDALPVTEDTPFPFKSTVRTEYNGQQVGVSHACGHDIHVAALLGAASVLSRLRGEIAGTVIFIFQPAEEGPPEGEEGGAALMLREGLFRDLRPDVVFGFHALYDQPVGTIAYTSGPTNATASAFRATLTGKSAHAAWPNLSIDPVVMAAEAVLAIQTIRSRSLSPLEPSVITVSQIHGGIRNNIIPDDVRLEGTVRTLSNSVQDDVERRMRQILDGIARGAGGTYQLEYQRGSPVNISNPALVQRIVPSLERAFGKERTLLVPPRMSADDFAYFAQEVPGMFVLLGIVKLGTTSGPHHTANFLADDSAIPVGMRAMSVMVLDYLRP